MASDSVSVSRAVLGEARRIVVKVGSSTLTQGSQGVNLEVLDRLVDDLASVCKDLGRQTVLVTSGAVACGSRKLGLGRRPRTIPEKQAAAAVGQGILMGYYETFFARRGLVVGQVLLTAEDLRSRRRFLNSRTALLTLLERRVVPIVNENDTVAVDEIRFGDNDTLSALVAAAIEADLLVLLSDVDGFYSADPRRDGQAQLVPVVEEIDASVEARAGGPGEPVGTGGMSTKLQAARIATSSGIPMVLANGSRPGVLQSILRGEPEGTLFVPAADGLAGRKRWIAFYPRATGQVWVDEGAARAVLEGGKSLLPSGVVRVVGNFDEGDLVRVMGPDGVEIARGLTGYGSGELQRVKGLKTQQVDEVLGYHKGYDEVIHRDNLVLFREIAAGRGRRNGQAPKEVLL